MSRAKRLKPLTIFQGLPGSGKSKRLIEIVNAARAAGRRVATFACSDSPWMRERESVQHRRILGCRIYGLECRLNHFVSTAEAVTILEKTKPGRLAVFEEAHYFGPEIADAWLAAARGGVEVLLCLPSDFHRAQFGAHPRTETNFILPCEGCGLADATTFNIVPGEDATQALCAACNQAKEEKVRAEIVRRLQAQAPYPGEKIIYQPVELPECADWQVLRPDSAARVEIMRDIFCELDLLTEISTGGMNYLDVGCNTGFFCHAMRQLGFHAEGEDVVTEDIVVAQMLDSFVRRDRNVFVAQDAHDYLRGTPHRMFDVTSAFAVFQWLMIQTSAPRGIECLQWLFAKTRRVCFLEMGYTAEDQYKDKIPINIDRAWVEKIMREKGGFAEVRVFPAGERHGVSRDLFVGIKPVALTDLSKAVNRCVPRDAKILVVSKGDGWLLKLDGCAPRHFPQDTKGGYAGYHPKNSAQAVALLDAAREKGARYLAFPPPSLWWLDFYGQFKKHLKKNHRRLETGSQTVIYELASAARPAAPRKKKIVRRKKNKA